MASKLEPCSIGILLGSTEDCHKTTYAKKVGTNKLAALPVDDVELIVRRSGLKAENDSVICFYHEMVYLRKYEFLQKSCYDPFEMHPTMARKKSLCIIDIANADKINKLVVKDIKPGQKLCRKRSSHLGSINESCIEEDKEYKLEVELHNLAATFSSLGCTPVKTKFAQRDRAVYPKQKAQEVQMAITDEVARRLNVDSNELQTCQNRREHLQSVFLERSIEDDDELTFKQWMHTDGTRLITRQELTCDLLEEIVLQINALTSHSFIAKAQAAYLAQQNESLTRGTAVVLLDCAKNYLFVVQDAVQGDDNSQATLHPLVAYYRKEDGNLRTISFCVVSDCLKHDATAVYAFISIIIAHLKKLIPGLSLVRYFSDGAASQYKNCKNPFNSFSSGAN
ncbi:Hypothetical predicted protein [Paramuricea clavata]|uniref:Uncharacterized protein n=1 Tax=Paramuricea clavata TaxID=317549 RepID=A0A7D9HA55_PARCT|nr:Hypothetical predicted protein [Paramuricea clavata]